MSIQPKEGGAGAGETRESVVFRMAEDMLDKLPQDYIPHEVRHLAAIHTHMLHNALHYFVVLIFCLSDRILLVS